MKNVIITGGSGMVGQALSSVINNRPDKYYFISSKDYDLTSIEETKQMFETIKPDYVIHLAAYVGGLFRNINQKIDMFEKNLLINYNIVKYSHEYGVKKLVACLSTCIFPDKVTYPINEEQLHNGPPHDSNNAYAYAKRMLEFHISLYRNQYNDNFICIIPTNIYGEYDNFNLKDAHVIPALIHHCYLAVKNDLDFVVKGTGTPLRQFIYSKDLANIILKLLYSDKQINNLIISVNNEVSIKDIAIKIASEFNYNKEIKYDKLYEDGQLKKTVSNSLLVDTFNDIIFTELDIGLKHTIKWFINHYEIARK